MIWSSDNNMYEAFKHTLHKNTWDDIFHPHQYNTKGEHSGGFAVPLTLYKLEKVIVKQLFLSHRAALMTVKTVTVNCSPVKKQKRTKDIPNVVPNVKPHDHCFLLTSYVVN